MSKSTMPEIETIGVIFSDFIEASEIFIKKLKERNNGNL